MVETRFKSQRLLAIGNAGLSLVEVLVALAVVGAIAIGVSSVGADFMKVIESGRTMARKEEIRNALRSRLDCGRTIAGINSSQTYIPLRDGLNNPLFPANSSGEMVSGDPTRPARVRVTARNATTGEFTIILANHDGSTEPLFRNVPLTCPP